MTITYRDASAADLPAIDRVFRASFCETFAHLYKPEDLAEFLGNFTPEAWAEEFADERYRFRLAEEDGQAIGFLKIGPSTLPIDTNRRAIELRQIYILKPHLGRGVAQALTEWAIDTVRAEGFEELYLTVYTDNHRARRFYDRHGFEEIGPYAFMVGSQADEDIIMRKTL